MRHSGLFLYAGLVLAFPAMRVYSREPAASGGVRTRQVQSQAAYQRGLEYSRAGDDEKALAEFKHAVELDPKAFEAYEGLDGILSKRQQWSAIVGYWTQYIAQSPNDGRAYCERGGAYSWVGPQANALRDADKACSLGIQRCCELAANYRRAHGPATSPPVAKKPWWQDSALLSTLAVAAVFVLPILALIIFWIVSAVRESRAPTPAPSAVASFNSSQWQRPPELAGPSPGRAPPASAGHGSDALEVTFTLTLDDFLELQKFKLRKTPMKRFASAIRTAAIGFVIGFGSGMLANETLGLRLITACFLAVVLPLVMPLEWKRRRMVEARTWAAKNPAFFSQTTVSISSGAIRQKNLSEDVSRGWDAVGAVVENKPYIYLFVGPSGAVIIPERAFKSASEAQGFLDRAKSFRQAAIKSPASPFGSTGGSPFK